MTVRSAGGTLLFDGDCGFCTAAAERIRRLGQGRFAAVPWQRADLAALHVTAEQASSAVQWSDGEHLASGAEAISAALIGTGGSWRLLGRVIAWPVVRVVARWTYEVVARHRHRLPGSTPACRVDPPREP